MEAVNGEKQKEMSERNREREHTCIDNIIITKQQVLYGEYT